MDDLESDPEFVPGLKKTPATKSKPRSKANTKRSSDQPKKATHKYLPALDSDDELDVIERPSGSSVSASKNSTSKAKNGRKRKAKDEAEFKSAEFIATDDEEEGPAPKPRSSLTGNRHIIAEVVLRKPILIVH